MGQNGPKCQEFYVVVGQSLIKSISFRDPAFVEALFKLTPVYTE